MVKGPPTGQVPLTQRSTGPVINRRPRGSFLQSMKFLHASLAGIALAALLGGCFAPSAVQTNHWRVESIGPRITYHFFGYDGTKDGNPLSYGLRESQSIGKTLVRRLLNTNPDNPRTSGL